ncbi:MAG: tetratricopeptide repeat protein [Bacteroidota bacterium]
MISRKDEIIEMLKKEPDDVFLNYALAMEYLAENNEHRALQQFEKVLQLDNSHIAAYYQCGMIYFNLNNKEKSLEYLRKGLDIARQKNDLKNIAEFQSAITNIENDLL